MVSLIEQSTYLRKIRRYEFESHTLVYNSLYRILCRVPKLLGLRK
nr:MAG TPA: hypothetical protein [Crassvirales sp.]